MCTWPSASLLLYLTLFYLICTTIYNVQCSKFRRRSRSPLAPRSRFSISVFSSAKTDTPHFIRNHSRKAFQNDFICNFLSCIHIRFIFIILGEIVQNQCTRKTSLLQIDKQGASPPIRWLKFYWKLKICGYAKLLFNQFHSNKDNNIEEAFKMQRVAEV